MPMIQLLIFCLFSLVLAGCNATSSGAVRSNEPAVAGGSGTPWFCQTGADQDGWECVQDEALAANPQPSRLPSSSSSSSSSSPAAAPAPNARSLPAAPGVERPEPVSAAQPVNLTSPSTEAAQPSGVPKHVRLSYKPDNPVAILDLPATYWVVQLVSVSEKESLEQYAQQHGLDGMSAARVWAKEQFFYVLILGVYETYEIAKEASRDLPAPFDMHSPWIRSVGSLQKAMMAADEIAGDSM